MNIAEISLPVSHFTNSFNFKTPQLEITANNIDPNTQYYVDLPNWNDAFDISFSKTNVTKCGSYEYFPMWEDLLKHYADNAFNESNSNMYKLFGNKQEIRNSLGNLDISLNIQLNNKLLESGGSISNIKTDPSNNIIYDCINTILSINCCCGRCCCCCRYSPERITDLFTPQRDVTQWLSIPFIAGDTLIFNVKYKDFTNNFTNNPIPYIEYLFKIHLT